MLWNLYFASGSINTLCFADPRFEGGEKFRDNKGDLMALDGWGDNFGSGVLNIQVADRELMVDILHASKQCEFYFSHVISNWEDRWRSHIGDPSAEV